MCIFFFVLFYIFDLFYRIFVSAGFLSSSVLFNLNIFYSYLSLTVGMLNCYYCLLKYFSTCLTNFRFRWIYLFIISFILLNCLQRFCYFNNFFPFIFPILCAQEDNIDTLLGCIRIYWLCFALYVYGFSMKSEHFRLTWNLPSIKSQSFLYLSGLFSHVCICFQTRKSWKLKEKVESWRLYIFSVDFQWLDLKTR